MSMLNIMWAGGSAFASVQKVHRQVLACTDSGVPVHNWLLQGSAQEGEEALEWNLSSAQLKGRHLWKLLIPRLRARFRQALPQDVKVVLLDGIGVARALLPVLKAMPDLRVVVLFHGQTRLHRSDRDLFAQFAQARLTVAAVSQTLAASLQQSLQRPVAVLRSAFDPSVFRAAVLPRDQARARLGVPPSDALVLGAVGRLVESKGFACLLDAFARVLAQRPDSRLLIIGEGAGRAALEAQVERLGLRDNVALPGHLDEAASLYRAFDWVAIPSSSEGLGLVLQEAVMAGVPVLTSDLEVFREQVGEAGWYAPADDVEAWAQLVARAFYADAGTVVEAQLRALAPEQAWQDFTTTACRLFSIR